MPGAGQHAAPAPPRWSWQAAVLAAYSGLALLYLRPIWRCFDTHITPDPYDPVFNLYLLKWVAHEVHRGFAGLWDAPFFYPERHALALSDHLLGPGIAAAASMTLAPNAIVAYNLLLFSSFVLSGWSSCYVLRRGGLSRAAAFLGGCMFAFSPFRWDEMSHLPVLLVQWIPLALWSFDRLLASVTWRRAALFLLFYLLCISGGTYLAYMIHVPLLALLLNRLPEMLRQEGQPVGRREIAVLGATGGVAAAALVFFFAPYWSVSRRLHLGWGTEVLQAFGSSAVSFLTPAGANLYSGLWPPALYRAENALFPGWIPSALLIAGLLAWWRGRRGRAGQVREPALSGGRRVALGVALTAAAAGHLTGELYTWANRFPALEWLVPGHQYRVPLLLLVGGLALWSVLFRRWHGRWPVRWDDEPSWPRGLLIAGLFAAVLSFPVVFAGARKLLPGLAAMRVPARLDAFISFTLVWFAAASLDRILGRLRSRRRRMVVVGLVTMLLVVELMPRGFAWTELPDEPAFPPVYAWIGMQPEVKVILELPLGDPDIGNPDLVNISYMYFGTRHWKPLVNGYGAHTPPEHEMLREICCWPLPDAPALAVLRRWGVTHVLLHAGGLAGWQRRALDRWQGEQVYRDAGDDRVYRLPAAGR